MRARRISIDPRAVGLGCGSSTVAAVVTVVVVAVEEEDAVELDVVVVL